MLQGSGSSCHLGDTDAEEVMKDLLLVSGHLFSCLWVRLDGILTLKWSSPDSNWGPPHALHSIFMKAALLQEPGACRRRICLVK